MTDFSRERDEAEKEAYVRKVSDDTRDLIAEALPCERLCASHPVRVDCGSTLCLSLLRTELERRKVPDTDLLAERMSEEALAIQLADDYCSHRHQCGESGGGCPFGVQTSEACDGDPKAWALFLRAERAALEQAERDRTELERLRGMEEERDALRGALMWCSGSEDFGSGGKAEAGWNKICRPLLRATLGGDE